MQTDPCDRIPTREPESVSSMVDLSCISTSQMEPLLEASNQALICQMHKQWPRITPQSTLFSMSLMSTLLLLRAIAT
jgi:hypothetical protein